MIICSIIILDHCKRGKSVLFSIRNIAKLGKEQEYLLNSGKAVILLNKRLQTFGLCFHAINEKNKARVRDLQRKLIASSINESNKLSSNDVLHPEIENLCFKVYKLYHFSF